MKIILFFFAFTSVVFAQIPSHLSILINGEKTRTIEAKQLQQLKTKEVDFYNSVTRRSESYRGFLFSDLMSLAVGDQLDSMVEVELISANGFRNYLSLESLKKTPAILSYERADGEKFVRYSQKEKSLVTLGPFYLVWDLKNVAKEEKDFYSSDYQITSINFFTKKTDFGVHEGEVNASLFLGFRTYKKYCLSCHALANTGGSLGPNLLENKIVEKKGADYVKNYMLAPQSVNPKSKMLSLPKFNNNQAMATGVVDFLTFMRNPQEILKQIKIEKDRKKYQELTDLVDQIKESK